MVVGGGGGGGGGRIVENFSTGISKMLTYPL